MRPWTDDVRYYEYTPATIHYDIDLDAFFVAAADVRSPMHPHYLTLIVAVNARDLVAHSLTVQEAIDLGQARLEQLIGQQRDDVPSLQARTMRVFDFSGMRLR